MPFVDPANHQRDLRDALDREGWDVTVLDLASDEYRLHSLWRLQSRWSPVGAVAHLAFVADPDRQPACLWGHREPRPAEVGRSRFVVWPFAELGNREVSFAGGYLGAAMLN